MNLKYCYLLSLVGCSTGPFSPVLLPFEHIQQLYRRILDCIATFRA